MHFLWNVRGSMITVRTLWS